MMEAPGTFKELFRRCPLKNKMEAPGTFTKIKKSFQKAPIKLPVV
jgi:hypothetical protein